MDGPTLLEYLTDPDTGEIVPITVVTDNGGPFRSLRFGAFITARPELRHIRTRVRTPGQNGVRGRAFQSLNYEHLYRQIDDALDPSREAETFRVDSTQSDHTKRDPHGWHVLTDASRPVLSCGQGDADAAQGGNGDDTVNGDQDGDTRVAGPVRTRPAADRR